MKIPLYKLFLITAAYATAFGPLAHMGTVGMLFGVFIGTAGSAFIVVFQRKDLVPVIIVSCGTLVGAFFGWLPFGASWNSHGPTLESVAWEITVVAVGGFSGALLFSFTSKCDTKRRGTSGQDI